MVWRDDPHRAERIENIPFLPVFERLAPPPSTADLVAAIEAWSKPGEIVVDVAGRGGWVARAAIAEQRRVADLESMSLTRLLADVVLRPPDVRQLEAAAHTIGAGPMADTSVKRTIDSLFASTCPGCGRTVALDSLVWETTAGATRATRREYRCATCNEQIGGRDLRHADPEQGDLDLSIAVEPRGAVWDALRKRFPVPPPDHPLPDQLLALHTPRQLLGLHAILERIDGESGPTPITSALRVAFLQTVLLASRLNSSPGRMAAVHISRGSVKPPAGRRWRERNPWSAFEEAVKQVRGFVQYLDSGSTRGSAARIGADMMALEEGTSNVTVGDLSQGSLRRLALHGERVSRSGAPSRIRLLLCQAPLPWTSDRLAAAYHGTAWVLGAGAASTLPFEALFGPAFRGTSRKAEKHADTFAPGAAQAAGQAAAAAASTEDVVGRSADRETEQPGPDPETDQLARSLARSLAVAAPALAQSGRAVVLLDGSGPEELAAAALGGAAAGYRLVEARLHRGDDTSPGVAVFVPPTGVMAPGPRTRANRPLPPLTGGAGDPGTIPGLGVFDAPQKLDEGPFRESAASLIVTETAVELLKARGEPSSFDNLFGDVLVGLDRSGQLARLGRHYRPRRPEGRWDAWLNEVVPVSPADEGRPTRPATENAAAPPGTAATAPTGAAADPVQQLVGVIRAELARPTNRRIKEIEPGHYWLAAAEDRTGTAPPLADRVEWAVFGLLSSARSLPETTVFDRTAGIFAGNEAPDGALLSACLQSYSAPESTPQAVVCSDRLEARSAGHDAMIATLAEVGHALGMRVWIGKRQQTRRLGGQLLGAWLDQEEREIHLPLITWAPEGELDRVDCAWYVRHKATFLFEVEWTAMLGEPVLVHHARYAADEKVVRFLVIPPERTELVRFKLERSALLRKAFADGNWHILKWNHLLAFAARTEPSLADLEPYLGLDPTAETVGQQLPLFGG
jgi:hypothetical protein